MAVYTLDELFTAQRSATHELRNTFPPYGLAHLDDFSPVETLEQVRMKESQFVTVANFCGLLPGTDPKGSHSNDTLASEYQPVSELQKAFAVPKGGLLGYVAMATTRHIVMKQLEITRVEDLLYESESGPRCMDAALASGYMVMGQLAEKSVQTIRSEAPEATNDQMTEMLNNSSRTMPRAFAAMENRSNRLLEIVYGVKRSGLGKQEAAEELEIDPTKRYGFQMESGKVVPENWDHASSDVQKSSSCRALGHPVFGTIWQHIAKIAPAVL